MGIAALDALKKFTAAVIAANTGTASGSWAAGNDSRITGSMQKASNLSDLASAAAARTNLGLGDSATKAVGVIAGTVAAGDDSRIVAALNPSSLESGYVTSPSLSGAGTITLPGSLGTIQVAPPTTDVNIVYCDTTAGSDANNGESIGLPKLTLLAALGKAVAMAGTRCVIYVKAPDTTPVREFILYNATKDIWLLPWAGTTTWHAYGSKKITAGWTADGGGIYHQSVSSAPSACFVTTLTDANAFQLRLTVNTSTPTTPAAGQWGHSAGTLYVHLPSDADPGVHTIEWAQSSFGLNFYGTGRVTIVGAVTRYAGTTGILAGGNAGVGGGKVHVINGVSEYAGSGYGTAVSALEMYCVGCISRANTNDGYNIGATDGIAATAVLIDCDGSWNGDEGASAHADTRMYIYGGRYHHNTAGGQSSVARAHVEMYDTICEYNHLGGILAGEAGCTWMETTTGVASGVVTRYNTGPGLIVAAGATVSVRNVTSRSNGASDSPALPVGLIAGRDDAPRLIVIPAIQPPVNQYGWSTVTYSSGLVMGARIDGAAQGIYIEWDVALSPGKWSIRLEHSAGTSRGIYDIKLDGVSLGLIDGYAGLTANAAGTVTTQIVKPGIRRLRIQIDTKNGSSSGYAGAICALLLTRTA